MLHKKCPLQHPSLHSCSYGLKKMYFDPFFNLLLFDYFSSVSSSLNFLCGVSLLGFIGMGVKGDSSKQEQLTS